MIKKSILLFIAITTSSINFAQEKTLNIQEATALYRAYPTERLLAADWKDAQHITYLSKNYQDLMIENVTNKTSQTLLSKSEIEQLLSKKYPEDTFNLYMFPYEHKWVSNNSIQFQVEGKNQKYFVQIDAKNKQIEKSIAFPLDAEEPEASKDLSLLIWLKKNNLMVTLANGETIQITNDEHIINGNSNVHRNEFGIHKGFWISPDQQKIMFYSKDETMVTDYPLVDFGQRVAENKNIKYPMAGMTSEQVKLKVYDLKTKQTTTLNIDGPKEQFLTMPTFTPSSEEILVGVLNRGQDELKVQLYNAQTGAFIRTLFTQTDKAYVEPSHDFKFLPNSKDEFLYITDRDGYRHMERYNLKGKRLQTYQHKDVVFKNYVGIDKKHIYYIGAANLGMDQLLYKTDIKSGKTTQLSPEIGQHQAKANEDYTLFYDEYSNPNRPNRSIIIDQNGKIVKEILNAKNPYEQINLPKVEYVQLTAADNETKLNGRLTYPVNFDANKKYPVMIYVYGGPHAQLVNNSFGYGNTGFDYYMAQEGFVVFTLDNRGSENRGKKFEQVIHRNLGQNEMLDQMKSVEFLKTKNFVDADRIGVYGWSFGGFMTTSLLTNYPETFKVGIAGGPVIDWKWYEVMYGERYMDTPEENPEGYEQTSLLHQAKNLKGRLLMIHGAQDPVVVPQHSMEFVEACIKAGVQIDYFLYPTHEHNVSGRDRIHLNAKIADYFKTHLK